MALADREAYVLIVEDNAANLMLVRAVLQRAGYRTAEAQSAEEAVHHIGLTRPSVILMDVQLPGEDGLSLARRLKDDPTTAGIPIIALTAHAMHTDRERARAAGCDGYLAKPINTRTLVDEMMAVLRGRMPSEASVGG